MSAFRLSLLGAALLAIAGSPAAAQVLPLRATASGTPTSGAAPLMVSFTGSATGGNPPYGYRWTFGDGPTVSTLRTPSHTYLAAGTYTARLTVTDSSLNVDTASVTITVTGGGGGPPVDITASATPTSGTYPLTVSFTASATGGEAPYQFWWHFGDESSPVAEQNTSHVYLGPGTCIATAYVFDKNGSSDAYSITITIGGPGAPKSSGGDDHGCSSSVSGPAGGGGALILAALVALAASRRPFRRAA